MMVAPRGVGSFMCLCCLILASIAGTGWGPCGVDMEDVDDALWLVTVPAPELDRVRGQYYFGKRKLACQQLPDRTLLED